MDDQKWIYRGRDIVRGEPGAETGSISGQMPFPHFVLWGQRLEHYARAVGFEPAGPIECNIRAVCWPSDAFDNALLTELRYMPNIRRESKKATLRGIVAILSLAAAAALLGFARTRRG